MQPPDLAFGVFDDLFPPNPGREEAEFIALRLRSADGESCLVAHDAGLRPPCRGSDRNARMSVFVTLDCQGTTSSRPCMPGWKRQK